MDDLIILYAISRVIRCCRAFHFLKIFENCLFYVSSWLPIPKPTPTDAQHLKIIRLFGLQVPAKP